MSTLVVPYIILAGVTADADYNILDLGTRTVVGVLWPGALTNTTMTFKSVLESGVFLPVAMGGSVTTFTAVTSTLETFSSNEARAFRALQRMILTSGGAEASDRVCQLLLRHLG